MCALPRPLNPTIPTLTVLFGLGCALALSATGNAIELIRKCLRLTLFMICLSFLARGGPPTRLRASASLNSSLLIRGRALRLRVLLVQLREPGWTPTGVDDHPVPEPDVLPRLD